VLLEKVADIWMFRGTKYQGVPIEEVAKQDPSYIRWAWRQLDLTDVEFYALSDCLDKFRIPRDGGRP
jgi:hypothetical protein